MQDNAKVYLNTILFILDLQATFLLYKYRNNVNYVYT